jgi:hypothetical protein
MTARAVRGEKAIGPHVSASANAADVVTVNFTEDGFTAFGSVWYRGQTLSVERGTPDWEMTVNPETGESWMDLDEDAQIEKYGQRMFRPGKWVGKSYDLSEDHLTEEDKALLAKATVGPVAPTGEPVDVPTATPRTRGSKRRTAVPPVPFTP